ncbi:hypothetical protein GCM10009133_17060 [Cocleimonas flava]|uniref:Uncharacterized protein n=1 Tax=Cocleimonas flava TaxID=634765 RepID=A0A4R1EX80_9GAMM|nr:hypothetical protein [Cocleimonas flava]TCJ84632.1 hypothetical protein EV695_2591 [Cocleimonas flava]
MNSYEKLAMIIVPSMGLAAILYFFAWYLPDVENGHFNDSQRLKGASYQSKVVYQKTGTLTPMNNQIRHNVKNNNTHKKGYIKWQGEKKVTVMPESLKNRRYKQTSNYIPQPVYNDMNNRLQSDYSQKIRLQKQAQARKQKKLDKDINDRECSYIEEMKERAEDRMKRGYKASQYNRLEKKRKFWAKKYANNCFGGIRYPR